MVVAAVVVMLLNIVAVVVMLLNVVAVVVISNTVEKFMISDVYAFITFLFYVSSI